MKKCIFTFIALICVAMMAGAQTPTVRTVLQPYIDRGDLPGIVAVIATPDKILSIESLGYQDIAKGKKMSPDVLFWIASQSKSITATAVMMLVDEGKVNLDEPVSTYLPELKDMMVYRINRDDIQVLERPKKQLTLRHLLSHTGGVQGHPGVQQQANKMDVLPLNLSLYVSAMTPLLFEPGERWAYSNQTVSIAGTVVERISGMPFEEFLQKRIFDPLDMKSATFWPTEKQLEKLAVTYQMDENGKLEASTIDVLQYPLSDRSKRFPDPGGGLFCTPEDLVKFYQMIANNGVFNGKRLLSESAVAEMGKKPYNFAWGLGWNVTDAGLQHGGAGGTDGWIYTKDSLIALYFIQHKGLPKANEANQAFRKSVKELYQLSY